MVHSSVFLMRNACNIL